MRKILKSKYLVTIVAMVIVPSPGNAASLLEVYQQALQSDPLIHEAEARRQAAEEAAPQARGLLFPQIDANGSWGRTDSSGSSSGAAVGLPNVPIESEADFTQWRISLRQTLFRWDQVVRLKQANKLVARAQANFEAAQQDLVGDHVELLLPFALNVVRVE